jgi:hypothetical protein
MHAMHVMLTHLSAICNVPKLFTETCSRHSYDILEVMMTLSGLEVIPDLSKHSCRFLKPSNQQR